MLLLADAVVSKYSVHNNWAIIIPGFLFVILLLFVLMVILSTIRQNRNFRKVYTNNTNFRLEPPDRLKPAEVAVLNNAGVSCREDISSTIIDLAIRRYLKIIRYEPQHNWQRPQYEFRLLKRVEDIEPYEVSILNLIFNNQPLKEGLSTVLDHGYSTKRPHKNLYDAVFAQLNDKLQSSNLILIHSSKQDFIVWVEKHFSKDALGTFIITLICIAIALIGVSIVYWNLLIAFAWACIVAISIPFYFVSLIKNSNLTEEGRNVFGEWLGFKQFLSGAESDKEMSGGVHALTSEQFFAYLPYAIALGVEREWAKQFAHLKFNSSQTNWIGSTATSGSLDLSSSESLIGLVGQLRSTVELPEPMPVAF